MRGPLLAFKVIWLMKVTSQVTMKTSSVVINAAADIIASCWFAASEILAVLGRFLRMVFLKSGNSAIAIPGQTST